MADHTLTTSSTTRRHLLAGIAAGAALAVPAAASAASADGELLTLYARWKSLEARRYAAEMEARRLDRERPEGVEYYPHVYCMGQMWSDPTDIDRFVRDVPARAAEHRAKKDIAGLGTAHLLEQQAAELAALRPVLADKIRRRREWEAATGYQALLEGRDELDVEAAEALEAAMRIAPKTQAGFLAVLDMMVSTMGGSFDPAGDWADEMALAAVRSLEAATGLQASAPDQCRGYRETSA